MSCWSFFSGPQSCDLFHFEVGDVEEKNIIDFKEKNVWRMSMTNGIQANTDALEPVLAGS